MTVRQNQAQKYREMMEAAEAYVVEDKPEINRPSDLARLMKPLAQNQTQECFWVLTLSTKNKVINIHHITTGLVDSTSIHPREVFRKSIIDNASRIFIVHNHPSGDSTPSAPDISTTKNLVEAGKIVGIEVMDHVIIGKSSTTKPEGWLSFSREGLM